jgi:hypothetical protein
MKAHVVLLLCGVSILTGCFRSGRLYPVQGPLAAQTPPPIFAAKVTGAFYSGSIKVTLADGEVCQGPWRMVPRTPTNKGTTPSDAIAKPEMAAAWDTVYGQGFYLARVLGARMHVQGDLPGSKGTTLRVEMYRNEAPEGIYDIKGVAMDNKGNIYKVVL